MCVVSSRRLNFPPQTKLKQNNVFHYFNVKGNRGWKSKEEGRRGEGEKEIFEKSRKHKIHVQIEINYERHPNAHTRMITFYVIVRHKFKFVSFSFLFFPPPLPSLSAHTHTFSPFQPTFPRPRDNVFKKVSYLRMTKSTLHLIAGVKKIKKNSTRK